MFQRLQWFLSLRYQNIKLCPGGKIIDYTAAEKATLVDLHNTLRNDLARGKLAGFKPAVRMGAMAWDDELALMADLKVRGCDHGHDTCHNTQNYPSSGQNIAYSTGSQHNTFNRTAVVNSFDDMINGWFSEHEGADMNIFKIY